jgi:hypothetical protein
LGGQGPGQRFLKLPEIFRKTAICTSRKADLQHSPHPEEATKWPSRRRLQGVQKRDGSPSPEWERRRIALPAPSGPSFETPLTRLLRMRVAGLQTLDETDVRNAVIVSEPSPA